MAAVAAATSDATHATDDTRAHTHSDECWC